LHLILRVLYRTDDPVAVQLKLSTKSVCELSERGLVAGARSPEQLLLV
jgi:hypothetical protein